MHNKHLCIYIIITTSVFGFVFVNGRRLCGPNQFRCRDGKKCIAAVDVCDNENHCRDHSDENHYLCSGNFSSLTRTIRNECSPGMYRCRFGGCIDASKLCNGAADCYDSSDETSDLCRKNRCQGKRFRCDYGGCIKNVRLCDGRQDCLDGSEESRKVCIKKTCSEGYFQCDYGACIPKAKVCDGKRHCNDNSDELTKMCQKNTTVPVTTTTEMTIESVTILNTVE